MELSRKSIVAPRIEMLPLIDVVFLLLVFFTYAMLSMVVHHGQSVDLPESSSAAVEKQEAISITIQAVEEGIRLFVDDDQVTLEILSERLRNKEAAQQDARDSEVQIFADKSVTYQEMFRVLDHIKLAGLTRISLQADLEGNAP